MSEKIVTIRGHECLNARAIAKFLDMPEGRLIKKAQIAGLTRFRTPDRPDEIFYACVQLKAMQCGEEIPALDIQDEESAAGLTGQDAIDARMGRLHFQLEGIKGEMRRLYNIEEAAREALEHLNWLDGRGLLTGEEEPMLQALREALGEKQS